MYEDLVQKTKELLENQDIVVIAISGHGGSGKSTLAEKLAKDFDIEDKQIVRTDNIYAKNYAQATGLFEVHDWAVITDLLSSLRTSNRLKYNTRDWEGVEGVIDVVKPYLIILEGIRLIRPETLPYFDLSVWIDCPLELATRRAKDRNREQGDSEEEIALWDTKWVPEARKYVKQVHPEKIANFIYTQSS